jgi:hypothetical protein
MFLLPSSQQDCNSILPTWARDLRGGAEEADAADAQVGGTHPFPFQATVRTSLVN